MVSSDGGSASKVDDVTA